MMNGLRDSEGFGEADRGCRLELEALKHPRRNYVNFFERWVTSTRLPVLEAQERLFGW